jgi:four helix bundle protein
MPYEPLEEKRVYQRAEELSDRVWDLVEPWKWFAKQTVGSQWVRAADSIGANIAEAGGRFHPKDVSKFLYYARGSLRETKYWLRRAHQRGLIGSEDLNSLDAELERLAREINQCINFQKTRANHERPDHPTT